MADLIKKIADNQKVLKRGPGGVLSEETPEEIQSLAQKAGLSSPPITPLGGSAIGANPDQQKMMGTPAQKMAALTIAQQPGQSLQDAQRLAQPRTQATAEESASQERAKLLAGLGQTQARAQQLIDSQVNKLAATNATAANQQLAQGVQADTVNALNKLKANPNDTAALAQINNRLGRPANNPITAAELQAMYEAPEDTIKRLGAETFTNQITVNDLTASPDFGYTPTQLSQLLGLSEDQVKLMSIPDLQNEINKQVEAEYQRTQQMESQAGSSLTGAAERGLLQAQSREASATGIRATEADIARLQDQIANADEVAFGGKSYKIEDLLKDSTISDTIAGYLDAPEGSQTRTDLEKNSPGLVQFIKNNETLLKQASDQLKQTTTNFNKQQQANLAIGNIGGQQLDPKILSTIIPGFGSATDKTYNAKDYPLLKFATSLKGNAAGQFVQQVNALEQTFPGISDELSKLSEADIKALGLESNSPKLQNYVAAKKMSQALESANSVDAVVDILFGKDVDTKTIKDQVAQNARRKALGLSSDPSLDILDSDADGKLDSVKSIKNSMNSQMGTVSLTNASKGKVNTVTPPSVSLKPLTSEQKLLYNKVGNILDDGKLSKDEAATFSSSLSNSDAWKLFDSGAVDKKSPLYNIVQQKVEQARMQDTTNLIQAPGIQSVVEAVNRNFAGFMGDAGPGIEEAQKTILNQINKLQQAQVGSNKDHLDQKEITNELKKLNSIKDKIDAKIKDDAEKARKAQALEVAKKTTAATQARAQETLKQMKEKSEGGISGFIGKNIIDPIAGLFK